MTGIHCHLVPNIQHAVNIWRSILWFLPKSADAKSLQYFSSKKKWGVSHVCSSTGSTWIIRSIHRVTSVAVLIDSQGGNRNLLCWKWVGGCVVVCLSHVCSRSRSMNRWKKKSSALFIRISGAKSEGIVRKWICIQALWCLVATKKAYACVCPPAPFHRDTNKDRRWMT